MKNELNHWRIFERKSEFGHKCFAIQYKVETLLSKFIRKVYFGLDEPERPLKTRWEWHRIDKLLHYNGECVRVRESYDTYEDAVEAIKKLQSDYEEHRNKGLHYKHNSKNSNWVLKEDLYV